MADTVRPASRIVRRDDVQEIRPPYEKATEEAAKAVQRVAGVADKSLDTANSLGAFLKTILGNGLDQLGGAFSDWAHVFRYEQAYKLATRVKSMHQQRGIEGKTIPIAPRLAIPLLQQATLEDDGLILDMWAGLISNATDPNRKTEARRSYCGLLSSLEPLDALALREIFLWKQKHPDRELLPPGHPDFDFKNPNLAQNWPNIETLVGILNISEVDGVLALENLGRLGLIIDYLPPAGDEALIVGDTGFHIPGQLVPVSDRRAMLDMSHTGMALMIACSP